MIESVAASLTSVGLDQSKETVTGFITRSETYVHVRWPWPALPVCLEAAGIALLLITAIHSQRREAPLWRDSLLPLLYHCLEEHTIRQQGLGPDVCSMEQSAERQKVKLAPARYDGRTVLKEVSPEMKKQ